MKKVCKRCLTLILLLFILSPCFMVSAQHYQSFSRNVQADGTTENVLARECFRTDGFIRASDLGLSDAFSEISDIFCGDDGLVYVLCSGTSQIVVIRQDLSFDRVINVSNENQEIVTFEKAQGVYVKGDSIYICDTQNARILVTNPSGNLQYIMEIPKSDMIPQDFIYQPTRLIIDNDGYTYVLSMGSYYGALVYLPDGSFGGFYGANNVQATALDTLSYIWDMLTGNDVKKSATQKTLPYAFVDFCFDKRGYMITCTGAVLGASNAGQINKLSPGGTSILYKSNSDGTFTRSTSFNFLENTVVKRNNTARAQNIVAVDTDDQDYIYALDNTYGIIYVYDAQCNLVSAFGGGVGSGRQIGNFQNATALTVCGTRVFVADAETKSVTVFEITDYGKLLKKAQSLYLAGSYEQAEPYWNDVLASDSYNQLAYRGLAIVSYKNGDFQKAMEYARAGLDYKVYDLAFQANLKIRIAQYFAWLFPLAVIVVAAIIAGLVYKSKKHIVWVTNPKIGNATAVTIHPFRTFGNIKEKNLGSVTIAFVLAVLFYVSATVKTVGSSFLFTEISDGNYNTLFTVAQTLGLVALWSIANWLVCSLFSGKGTLKEVFMATTYCLIPIIVYNFLRAGLSYIMPLSGKAFLDGLYVAVVLYTVYLLCVAFTSIHDYSLSKFIGTAIVTVLGMLLVIFVIFMIVILLQQLWEFCYSVFVEAVYR